MTSFTDLVDDVIFVLMDHIERERVLNSLSRTTRRLHHILTWPLYSRHVRLHGGVALSWAAERNRVDMAERLLAAGADAMAPLSECDDVYPLFIAAKFGNAAMVKLLLETEGVCPDKFASGTTPLAIAAKRGHVEVVRQLLPRADPGNCETFGRNGLVYAAEFGHTEMVKLFIQGGWIDPRITSGTDRTLLSHVVKMQPIFSEGYNMDVIQFLLPLCDLAKPDTGWDGVNLCFTVWAQR